MPTYQIEMLWRCPCTHAENRGHDTTCAKCGRPRTEKEAFYMPGDTSEAAAVTAPERLREAHAGADWACRYCGSNQRRLGSLEHPEDISCAQCGASQAEGEKKAPPPPPAEAAPPEASPPAPARKPLGPALVALVAVLAVVLGLGALLRTKVVDVTVTRMAWSHSIAIERYQAFHHEGWSPGPGAVNVQPLGPRFHHMNHVVTGHHDEPTTERVRDGETCTPVSAVAPTCSTTPKTCRSNKNGYATCSGGDRVCSGGRAAGKSCSPKYKDVTRHHEVTDYTEVPETREWYAWDAWAWTFDRDVTVRGDAPGSEPLPWPSAEELAPRPLAAGEQERQGRRAERYLVVFTSTEGKTYELEPPGGETAFRALTIGEHRKLKVSGLSSELLPLSAPGAR